MSMPAASARAEVVVDLDAISRNVRTIAERVRTAVMVVVKADGYGHGMLPAARAARAAGAQWLGVATPEEALALRAGGDTGRLLSWIATPGEDYREVLAADVDLNAASPEQLAEIAAAATAVGRTARVHLKLDTGLSRGGAPRETWPEVFAAARSLEERGSVRVVGIWSHFACSDEPDHPANQRQEDAFRAGLAAAEEAGLRPEVRHLSNSAGALFRPSARFDLVRIGIAAYGISPAPEVAGEAELGLEPAMTLRGRLLLTKQLAAGEGVSYGHTYVTPAPTRVGLVPLGYGDGIPRIASSRAEVQVAGARCPVLGRICMDQFVVAVPEHAVAGDEVVLFGTGAAGEPTAQDWARWCETIGYEIVTRVGARPQRRWVGGPRT